MTTTYLLLIKWMIHSDPNFLYAGVLYSFSLVTRHAKVGTDVNLNQEWEPMAN